MRIFALTAANCVAIPVLEDGSRNSVLSVLIVGPLSTYMN